MKTAVLIPCYNEEIAIAKVVADFAAALPEATIYVYDNNSSDRTIEVARQAGAVVRSETRQGKGYVVRRMFADIDADIYVMVDGDDTYEAAAAPRLIALLRAQGLDMVNGARNQIDHCAYRAGHKFGNRLLTGLVRAVFGKDYRDMLSGYRVFSRRFVKSFPVTAAGFEIETELTIHSLELDMPVAELPVDFTERPAGSASKLRTFSDGFRILWTIVKLLKQERPMALFGWIAMALALSSTGFASPLLAEYLETGTVPRLPTALLSTGLMLSAMLSLSCGLILDTVTRGREEVKRLAYLAVPGVAATLERAA